MPNFAPDRSSRAPDPLSQVAVPVYFKLAEFDQLWDIADCQRIAALNKSAPRVETGLFAAAGHCISFHRRGADFHA